MQHAPYTWFLPRPSMEELNVPLLKNFAITKLTLRTVIKMVEIVVDTMSTLIFVLIVNDMSVRLV